MVEVDCVVVATVELLVTVAGGRFGGRDGGGDAGIFVVSFNTTLFFILVELTLLLLLLLLFVEFKFVLLLLLILLLLLFGGRVGGAARGTFDAVGTCLAGPLLFVFDITLPLVLLYKLDFCKSFNDFLLVCLGNGLRGSARRTIRWENTTSSSLSSKSRFHITC